MRSKPSLQPLGDQAVLAHFDGEAGALRFAATVRREAPAWLVDVVQAYAAVAVFFDPGVTTWAAAADRLGKLSYDESHARVAARQHELPCCYEMNLDLAREELQLVAKKFQTRAVMAVSASGQGGIPACGRPDGFYRS